MRPEHQRVDAAPCLVFSVRGASYAVPAAAVREVVHLPELTFLPEAPPHVAGVIYLRGQVVPVVDLALRLGYPRQCRRLKDRVIILDEEDHPLGLWVNAVHDVRMVTPGDLAAVPERAAGGPADLVLSGMAQLGGDLVGLLRLEAVQESAASLPALPEPTSGAEPGAAGPEPAPAGEDPDLEIFRQRALRLAQPLQQLANESCVPVAVVRIGGELFGLGLDHVREFANLRDVVPMPCCPPHIAGLMNLRGEVITLVDLTAALGLAAAPVPPRRRVVIAEVPPLRLGIPVDAVLEVRWLGRDAIAPVPALGPGSAALKGAAAHGERMLGIPDLEAILTGDRMVVNEEAR